MRESRLTAFLPDQWEDFRALALSLTASAVGDEPHPIDLYRWEEWSFDDGRRTRGAHLVRSANGPSLDDILSIRGARAHEAGFRIKRLDNEAARTVLVRDTHTLSIARAPLPPRLVVLLEDRLAQRGAAQYPAIEPLFRLAAAAGAAKFARLFRFAELDLENGDRFNPPTTEMTASGAYDHLALCASLERAGFVEDGDVWVREQEPYRTCVNLGDDEVHAIVAPRWLSGASGGPSSLRAPPPATFGE